MAIEYTHYAKYDCSRKTRHIEYKYTLHINTLFSILDMRYTIQSIEIDKSFYFLNLFTGCDFSSEK